MLEYMYFISRWIWLTRSVLCWGMQSAGARFSSLMSFEAESPNMIPLRLRFDLDLKKCFRVEGMTDLSNGENTFTIENKKHKHQFSDTRTILSKLILAGYLCQAK